MSDDDETQNPAAPIDLAGYAPVVLQPRRDGWTVERQRVFLTALAETASISLASSEAGISARSAYRLRARPEATAFAEAWEQAMKVATIRLLTIAFERAARGTVQERWKNGELVGESRTPSDKLLIFLLSRLLPAAAPDPRAPHQSAPLQSSPLQSAGAPAADPGFPATLDRLVDSDVPLVRIETRDFYPAAPDHDLAPETMPGDPTEDW